MKILKNKLFVWSIWVITALLIFQVYTAYSQGFIDTHSYLRVIEQEVYINNELVPSNSRVMISSGDTIRTSSLWRAVIEWWDGSITRVWEKSEIYIEAAQVNSTKTRINIRFELFSWRTWSNVVSFLWNDSSFTQKIEWFEAGVRGTIFDVDLEAWFIHVSQHFVELTHAEWESILLTPETPFDIIRWHLIDLDVFLRSFQDAAWAEFNRVSDSELRSKMLHDLQESIDRNNPFLKMMEWFLPHYRILYELDTAEWFEGVEMRIAKLSESARQKTRDLVEARYQDFNFVHPNEEALYARKIRYQQALLLLSDDTQFQRSILERSILELKTSVESWNTQEVELLTTLIASYSDATVLIDTQIIDTLLWWLEAELWNELQKTRDILEDIFQIDFSEFSIGRPEDILESTSSTIENFLEDTFGDKLRNLLQ